MRVAAIILAAGGSTRFGRAKQFANFQGQSLVRRAVAAAKPHCSPIIAVAGADVKEISADLASTSATVIVNLHWREGLGTSVRTGIEKLQSAQIEAVLLLACDQPFVTAEVVASLIQLATETGKPIAASAYSGTLGIPALFQRSEFAALGELQGDRGAKGLINSKLDRVATLEFPAGVIDIDTPDDLERLHSA